MNPALRSDEGAPTLEEGARQLSPQDLDSPGSRFPVVSRERMLGQKAGLSHPFRRASAEAAYAEI